MLNGVSAEFLYDGLNVAQQFESGRVTTYLHTLSIDESVGIATLDGSSFSVHDALGSALAVVDGAGTPTASYTYEPFGATAISGQDAGNPFQFTGRENDHLADLYYYRARYYHPHLQRFIATDPIGVSGGDINLYAYVANNPIRYTDGLGLELDLTYAGSLVEPLERVRKTKRGAAIFDALERSPNVYRIRETAGSEPTQYYPETREIVVNTRNPSIVCTTAGRKPAPPEAGLAHEGGHALGSPDAGPNNMVNVNANENPVRRELGYPIRLTYGGTKCP
jgi:RHS repeat-associated protein